MRTEANLHAGPHELVGEIGQVAFEIGHRDLPVHVESLDLMEARAVGCVGCIAPVTAAGRDDSHGRFLLLHHANLHRRRLRAQQLAGLQVERVLRVAGRMIGRRVERVEVVVLGLDVRPIRHRETHRVENIDCSLDDLADGMFRAQPAPLTRQRVIKCRLCHCAHRLLHLLPAYLDQGLEFVF